jgi:hypothetical protein
MMCFQVPAAGQALDRPVERQIAEAVSPLPEGLRSDATVLGYRAGRLTELRDGTNGMICLADDPARAGFHAACYHRDLEPFMARGRELRARGLERAAVDSARQAEVEEGRLVMPEGPRALYSLTSDQEFDPAAGAAPAAGGLYVIYMPYATEASSGISATPARDRPWLMFPGTYRAHVMISR